MLSSTSRSLLETLEVLQSKRRNNWNTGPSEGSAEPHTHGKTHEGDPVTKPEIQLRAFQLQQLAYTLLELELPRLLAPDLPSNRSLGGDVTHPHSNGQTQKSPALFVLVTTSLGQEWVICAPAAFLGCGSRLSGSLSGIEP